jgi:hypothetical protein
MMRESDLRTQLQHRLSTRFNAALWDLLVDLDFVAEVLVFGALDLDQLEDRARRILAAGTQSAEHRVPAPAPREPRLGQERAWALSQLVAAHAHHDLDVIAFRHKYLGDALVEWADLDTWITARAKLDGEPTTDVTIALPASVLSDPDADELHISRSLEGVRPARVATRRLDYALPENDWIRRVAVTADGALDRLRVLADALAKAYSWTPAQASIFVLSGVTPSSPPYGSPGPRPRSATRRPRLGTPDHPRHRPGRHPQTGPRRLPARTPAARRGPAASLDPEAPPAGSLRPGRTGRQALG